MQRRGTGFTNVSQMLRANQGNRLGATVSTGIGQQTQRAQSGLQQSQEQFQQQSEKERLDSAQNLQKKQETLQKISPGFTPQSGQQQDAQQAPQMQSNIQPVKQSQQLPTGMDQRQQISTPGAIQPVPEAQPRIPTAQQPASPVKSVDDLISGEDIDFFSRLRRGQYEGPRELENQNLLTSRALQAEQTGELTRSAGGREELLRRFVGGQDYTSGQRRMDQALLSQDPNVNLGSLARQARGSVDRLQRAEQATASTVRDLEGRAADLGKATVESITQATNPISSDLDRRIAAQREVEAERAKQIQQIQNRLRAPANIQQFRADQDFVKKEAADLGRLKSYVMVEGPKSRGQGMGMTVTPAKYKEVPVGTPGAFMGELDRLGYVRRRVEMNDFQQRQAALNQKQAQLAKMQEQNPDIALSDVDRARQGVRQAVELGLMSQADADEIVGRTSGTGVNRWNIGGVAGLAAREQFDLASALADRLNTIGPQNLTRTGFATEDDRARLTALERLMGEQGTDLEFSANDPRFQTTRATADVSGIREFLQNRVNRQPGQPIDVGGAAGGPSAGDLAMFLANPLAVGGTMLAGGGNLISGVSNTLGSAAKAVGKIFSDKDKKESISYDPKDVEKFMGRLKASSYNYKPEIQDSPLASKNREIGVMAQDLEKSELGKEAVINTPKGKIVDYDNLGPKMLASIANLNERLKKMEKQ